MSENIFKSSLSFLSKIRLKQNVSMTEIKLSFCLIRFHSQQAKPLKTYVMHNPFEFKAVYESSKVSTRFLCFTHHTVCFSIKMMLNISFTFFIRRTTLTKVNLFGGNCYLRDAKGSQKQERILIAPFPPLFCACW